MNSAIRRAISAALGVLVLCVFAAVAARAQAAQTEKPLMADDVFKNIQVLRGLSVEQLMGTMGFMASALSLNCSECHDVTDSASFALDNERKNTARRMVVMVDAFNKANFGGKREVTCYTCHRGSSRPKVNVSLVDQYSAPPEDDPNEVELAETPPPNTPSPDQLFNRYIQALGGAQKLAALKSFVARGTYAGFDTSHEKVPVDIFAQASNHRTTVVHLHSGDNVRVFDGQNAWNTSTGSLMPVPVRALSGAELEGAKLEAALSFPAQIKTLFKDWRTGFPATAIGDNLVDVVQATGVETTPVKFYFDKKTGLLLRVVRYADTPIGTIPSQVDYSDYRDVAGVKVPFKMTVTWTDGQTFLELSEVRANAAVDAGKFTKPQAPSR
jgi:photosynthetic reaction center cytochrome c subunit